MWRKALGAMALTVTLAACGAASRVQDVATSATGVTITVVADPGVVGERNELRVRLDDAQRRPLTGARVRVQLEMPAMPMRRAPLLLTERAPGQYVAAQPDFDMGGDWTARVSADDAAGAGIEGTAHLHIRD